MAKSLYIVFCLMMTSAVYGQLPQTGLYFYAHDYNIDKRTSLLLNGGNPYPLDNQNIFTLDFDFYLRDELIKFGYIFRIISNTDENFDLIINNELNLFFVTNHQDTQLENISASEQWCHASVSFDKKQNLIFLHFNGEERQCSYPLKKINSLCISFGLCEFKNFQTNDVSPFILKNVQVGENNRKIHYWALDRHGDKQVYDELKHAPAIAHNPCWLMDNHIYWKKVEELEADVFPQIAFDSIHDYIYILQNTGLIQYALTADSVKTFPSAITPNELYNQLMFDPLSGKLLLYSFNPVKINEYDFTQKKWIYAENLYSESDYAHHNRYISCHDSALYLFGGYGHYKYNSKFFRVCLQNPEQTVLSDFSAIVTPRYLAAMGGNQAGDKLYILGGKGAEMGRQELSPKNFSDLFEVDLKTNEVKYLFDIISKENTEENVYSNSLVTTQNDSCFYVLAYSNNKYSSAIRLREIDMTTRTVKMLADSIDFYFRDVTAFCDLYFSPHLSKLIAVVAYAQENQTGLKADIYTLDFPPLQLKNVIQTHVSSSFSLSKTILYLTITFVCLVAFFIFFRLQWLVRRKQALPVLVSDPANEPVKSPDRESKKDKLFYNFRKKAILFLGGFQVFDQEGKNITGDFTPTLKYILVLIVLYTVKYGKGISSARLQELLWSDKTEEAARNNRSVNVRKLRVLLQSLGDIDVANDNGYWTISLSDDVLLDYKEVLRLIQKVQGENTTSREDLLHLLELLASGTILPNIQLEWVDNFKTDFSNVVIDALIQVVHNPNNRFHKHPDIRLKIADCILSIDSINEEALAIKCNALYITGKKSLAKAAFDNFMKEYQLLLGEPFYGSIKDFIQ